MKAKLFVTRPELKQTIEDMKMLYAATAQEAFEMAKKIKGEDATVTIIPNGISVIL